jgi:cyclase
MAAFYYDQGADELVFYDITASHERRDIMIETVRKVAERIFIPFSVGGGIRTVEDMRHVLLAGAEKVSINSAAIREPGLITKGAEAFGSQAIVLGMDVKRVPPSERIPSGYEMVIDGGRTFTGLDALAWAKEGERLGAGEICLNSIDADGTQKGYELRLTKLIATSVNIPVIASGGAGAMEHIHEVFAEGMADAALIASITHYGTHTVKEIKSYLHEKGIKVRMSW